MEKEIASVVKYFRFFRYSPKIDEIYTFLPKKISRKRLKTILEAKKYTLPEYSKMVLRRRISKRKLENWRFKIYLWFISLFPPIKLVGLSGSISMMNADLDDDIDLFIITARNRLFTARFLATIIAFIMGLKRAIDQYKAPNKVCLNLFFDEKNLKIPHFKQNKFVGHEVLQMKPLINKNHIYERFLGVNQWVFNLFPNAHYPVISAWRDETKRKKFGDWFEKLLKKFQLKLINQHRTREIINDSQLWFHPDDFEKKVKI
jgi:hypothetical protein